MYLSDRDIAWAIQNGDLIVSPAPTKIDPTSIDLHLDAISQAKVWDIQKLGVDQKVHGYGESELRLGTFKYVDFAEKYLMPLPENPENEEQTKVFRRGNQVVIRPGGFVLWQTKEVVGTPDDRANLICFVDGKSTRARTGILVHFTAPTIHAGWSGKVVLEITNLGPFTFLLEKDDVIAQIIVARITSSPEKTHAAAGSSTLKQENVGGSRQNVVSPDRPPKRQSRLRKAEAVTDAATAQKAKRGKKARPSASAPRAARRG